VCEVLPGKSSLDAVSVNKIWLGIDPPPLVLPPPTSGSSSSLGLVARLCTRDRGGVQDRVQQLCFYDAVIGWAGRVGLSHKSKADEFEVIRDRGGVWDRV
jgi:hypothetical protein